MVLEEKQVFPIIRYWARRFSRSFPRFEEDELFNQAFLGKVQKASDITHVSTCVRCDIIDYLRTFKRVQEHETYLPDDVEVAVEYEHQATDFLDKVMSLVKPTLRDRTILYMLYYQSMTLEDIANSLGVTKTTIFYYHKKIMDKLQETAQCLLQQEESLTSSIHHQRALIASRDVLPSSILKSSSGLQREMLTSSP